MWSVLICDCWTRLVFDYQEIERKELKGNFVWLARNCKEK